MKRNLVYSLLLISNLSLCQNVFNSSCDYKLSYEQFGFFEFLKIGKQQLKKGADTIIEINLHNCRGASEISIFKNTKLIIKGKTVNGLRLLAKQLVVFDLLTYEKSINVVEYYEPIREGLWEYWDGKGEKIKEEVYKKGILKAQ